MADSIQQQLADRRRREAQRHDAVSHNRQDSSEQNVHDVPSSTQTEAEAKMSNDVEDMESPRHDNNMPVFRDHETVEAVEEVFRTINKHKSNLRELNQRKERIETQIENEARALARQEEILRRVMNQANQNNNNNNNNNDSNTDNNNNNNGNTTSNENKDNNKNDSNSNENDRKDNDVDMVGREGVLTQEEKDREIALAIQRQLEREDENDNTNNRYNNNNNNNSNNNNNVSTSINSINDGFGGSYVIRRSSTGPNGSSSTFSFSSHNIGNQNPLSSSVFGDLSSMMRGGSNMHMNMNMNMNGLGHFGGFGQQNHDEHLNDVFSQMRNMPFISGMNDNTFLHRSGMGGFVFGNPIGMNGFDPNNMTYEQLLQMFPNVPRGANEVDIQALPTDEYKAPSSVNNNSNKQEGSNDTNTDSTNKENKDKNTNPNKNEIKVEKCSICLEEFKNGESIRRLPCLHIFHTNEIDRWLRTNHICPICRIPIDEQPQQHEHEQQQQQNN